MSSPTTAIPLVIFRKERRTPERFRGRVVVDGGIYDGMPMEAYLEGITNSAIRRSRRNCPRNIRAMALAFRQDIVPMNLSMPGLPTIERLAVKGFVHRRDGGRKGEAEDDRDVQAGGSYRWKVRASLPLESQAGGGYRWKVRASLPLESQGDQKPCLPQWCTECLYDYMSTLHFNEGRHRVPVRESPWAAGGSGAVRGSQVHRGGSDLLLCSPPSSYLLLPRAARGPRPIVRRSLGADRCTSWLHAGFLSPR